MAIQMKRQGGGASNNAAATIPTALAYGEIGIDSAGNIYCGNGKAQVTSQVKNAANVLFLYKGTYKKNGWVENSAMVLGLRRSQLPLKMVVLQLKQILHYLHLWPRKRIIAQQMNSAKMLLV